MMLPCCWRCCCCYYFCFFASLVCRLDGSANCHVLDISRVLDDAGCRKVGKWVGCWVQGAGARCGGQRLGTQAYPRRGRMGRRDARESEREMACANEEGNSGGSSPYQSEDATPIKPTHVPALGCPSQESARKMQLRHPLSSSCYR